VHEEQFGPVLPIVSVKSVEAAIEMANASPYGLQVPLALRARSNCLGQVLDLYWSSPESGDVWYKSGRLEKTICCRKWR